MSNPFDAIQAPVRQLHQQAGWSGWAINYAPDGSGGGSWYDDTGGSDSGWIDDGGEPITIRVETGTAPDVIRNAGGREITGDATITVDPSEHPGGHEAFTNGAGENNRATEIVDEDSGERYQVNRVLDEHSGLLLLDCELLT